MYSLLRHLSLLSLVGSSLATYCPKANTGINPNRAAAVSNAFIDAGLAPGPISTERLAPAVNVVPSYNGRKVNLGNSFATQDTITPIDYTFTAERGFDPTDYNYTFIMIDPDAPSPDNPLLRFFLHEITYDLKPPCASTVSNAPEEPQAKVLASYMALTPLSVAKHRYVQLILRQPTGTFAPTLDPVVLASRGMFKYHAFVKQYGLTLVGANFLLEGAANPVVPPA